MHKAKQIKNIKNKVYEGQEGAKRKRLCEAYLKVLPQIYSNILKGYLESLQEGENISCKKGCIYCCYQHVSVDIAHGLLVVDYLYSHDIVLQNFLNNYLIWEKSVGSLPNEIDTEYNLAINARNPAAILEHSNSPEISKYFDMQVSCPFLQNSKCSIYDIRPLNCAGHFSKSPCEWCSNSSPDLPQIREIIPSISDLMKLRLLPSVTSNLFLPRFTLPKMIYELIVDGLPVFLNKEGVGTLFK